MSTTPSTAARVRVRRWVIVAVLAGTAQLALAPAAFAGGKSCFFSFGEESSGSFTATSSGDTGNAATEDRSALVAGATTHHTADG